MVRITAVARLCRAVQLWVVIKCSSSNKRRNVRLFRPLFRTVTGARARQGPAAGHADYRAPRAPRQIHPRTSFLGGDRSKPEDKAA